MAAAEIENITLTTDSIWEDEFEGWTPVGQTTEIAEDGTLVEEHTVVNASGRPIRVIVSNATLDMVRAVEDLRDTNRDIMVLTLPDGRDFSVYWNHNGGPVVVEPVKIIPDYSKIAGLPFFRITLNFMKVD